MSAPGWTGSLLPRWLSDPAYRGLSAAAWGLHCWAIVWCVEQECDGLIPLKALHFVASPMLSRAEADYAATELVEAELWTKTASGGFQIVDWGGSQATAGEIADRRERWRREKRQQRSGAESGAESTPVSGTDVAEVRPGYGPGPVRRTAMSNTQATEAASEADPWLVGYGPCSVDGCTDRQTSPEGRRAGLCPRHMSKQGTAA